MSGRARAAGLAGLAALAGWAWWAWRLRRGAALRLDIRLVATEAECDALVRELRRRCAFHRAIGFDCEWVSDGSKRRAVSMLQLASHDGLCGLFRLSCMKNIPDSLKELLEDENICKLGVVPLDDAKYLYQDYSVMLNCTLDVRHIARMCGYQAGGLASLAKAHLGLTLDKSWRIRCSDWEADTLTERQKQYAATDAYAAIKIFINLIEQHYKKKYFVLFRPYKESAGCWENIDEIYQRYADISFKANHKGEYSGPSIRNNKENWSNERVETMKKKYPHSTRSKPLYQNCYMLAPDGEILCTCDNKKAQWYLEKGLADAVKEDPFTVKLRFEPAGRCVGEVGRYYQLEKENKCVVCGKDNSYIRKNVVPREYRKFFPDIMKDHSSHDVVLLCISCHQHSNLHDQRVRAKLAQKCDAPLSDPENVKYLEDCDVKAVRSAARALLYQAKKHNLPEGRRKQLETIILNQFPTHSQITEQLLQEACELQVVFENLQYESHGSRVVDYFIQHEGGLLKLEKLWREHFLDTMKPKYMPELWSINHNEERLMIRVREGRIDEADIRVVGLDAA